MKRAWRTAYKQATTRTHSVAASSRTQRHHSPIPKDNVVAWIMAGGTALVAAGYCYSWQNQSPFLLAHHPVSSNTTRCDPRALFSLRKHRTLQTLETSPSQQTLKHHYRVHWKQPLGEGTFGKVYMATRRSDGTRVAVKEISKHVTDSLSFQAEFQTLRQLRSHHGGHPNICSLIDNYASDTHYYLVLDLVNGPELFEHLVANGAYSEFEAARLIREVASALAFLHGLNIVHMDLKPENIMLSSSDTDQAVVKLVDFGTAISLDDPEDDPRRRVVNTPAYAPPEMLKRSRSADTSYDLWSLGVVLYILLTGIHPFDLTGDSSDAELKQKILQGRMPPLRESALTAHLSDDAINVIEKLLTYNPRKRLTAHELLEHPWVRGETASRQKMVGSDQRLSKFEAKIFGDLVNLGIRRDSVDKRLSLIQAAFINLSKEAGTPLSMTNFTALLSENMKSRYFPRGHNIYREGDLGEHMYFLNSGAVEVYTKDGSVHAQLGAGDFFGEGALVHPKKIRNASIRCLTPVHTIEVPRETFEKYMATNEDAKLTILEVDKLRRSNRAQRLLRLQKSMEELELGKGDYVFRQGDEGDQLFIVEEGNIDTLVRRHLVFTAQSGDVLGEHSLIFDRPRNVSARCASKKCRLHSLSAEAFSAILDAHPTTRDSIRDICLRRQFQKAVCVVTCSAFPKNERALRRAFDKLDKNRSGVLELKNIHSAIEALDPTLSDNDIKDVLNSLDINESGEVSWAEFKRIFGMNSKNTL